LSKFSTARCLHAVSPQNPVSKTVFYGEAQALTAKKDNKLTTFDGKCKKLY